MEVPVPALSVVFMIVSLLGSFAAPIAIAIFLKKKYRCNIPPFFIGCAVMLLFAFVLEQLAHAAILTAFPALRENVRLFSLYGGLMAGLFEETGRYVAFRTVMKKYRDNDRNALMYGAGHGGFEAVVILGLTMISNLAIVLTLRSGGIDALPTDALSEDQRAVFMASVDTILYSPSYIFLIGLVERIAAIALHMAMSVIVWYSVKGKRLRLFFLAIFLHALADFVTALLSFLGVHPVAIEAVIIAIVVAVAWIARYVSRRQTPVSET